MSSNASQEAAAALEKAEWVAAVAAAADAAASEEAVLEEAEVAAAEELSLEEQGKSKEVAAEGAANPRQANLTQRLADLRQRSACF